MKLFYYCLITTLLVLLFHSAYSGCGNNKLYKVNHCGCTDCPEKAGDPFDPYTGNEHREVRDLEVWGGVGEIPLVLKRYYNSRESSGYWSFSFQYLMLDDGVDGQGRPQITLWFPEGGGITFSQSATNPSLWLPLPGIKERLFQQGDDFFFQNAKGHRFRFRKLDTGSGKIYQLEDIRDRFQNLYKLNYDADHRLIRVTEPGGRYFELIYGVVHGYNIIIRATTSDGRNAYYNYTFDTDGILNWLLLTSVDYGDGTSATYTYYPPSYSTLTQGSVFRLLEHAIDPRYEGTNVNMYFTYDMQVANGYIKEERNGKTGKVMVTLNTDDGNRWVCYANGRVQHFVMPEELEGRTKEYVDGLGRSTKYTFNEISGFIKTETDALGRTTTYTRSIYANPTEITHPDGSVEKWTRDDLDLVLTHTDELGRVTSYVRDNLHRITSIHYPDGATEGFTYNDFGEVLTHKLRNGAIESNIYDNRGLKTAFTDAAGNVIRYTYDAADRLASVIDANGNTTKREYNERGLVIKMVNADNSFQSYTYDEFGNRTGTTNEIGNTWKAVFDEFKRILSSTDPLNRATVYSYDLPGGGCGCSHDNNSPTKITLPSGRFTEITYDVEWQKRSETIGAGSTDAATTSYEYDAAGNLTAVINPKGQSWLYAYNARDRRVSVTDPLSNATQTTLDDVGNELMQKRADGGTTVNLYDDMNRLIQTTDPKGQVTKMEYDNEGNLVRLTDAKNNSYRFEYDLLDRRTKMIYPGGSSQAYAYDPVGNLKLYTNRSGDVRTYTYDNRNREIRSDWSDNTPDIDRTYDAAGRLLSLSSSISRLTYTYNEADEMTGETQNIEGGPGTKTLNYTYNSDGLRNRLEYPGGTKVGYDYTGRNQVKTISLDNSPLTIYSYDLNDNRINKTLANGTQALYTYDASNRVLSIDNRTGSASFARFDYGYDNVNRRTFVKRNGDKGDVYGYDATDQVTGVQYEVTNPENTPANPLRSVNYNWDATSNRTTVIDNDSTTIYSANSLNQYTHVNNNPLNYNANGDLSTYDGWNYSYDAQDRLIKAEKGSINVTFTYDARNRKVKQSINETLTFLYYDNWNLIEERSAGDDLLNEYVYGPQTDEILTKTSAINILYYHQDVLGSVVGLTNVRGDVVEQYNYDIFGEVTIRDGGGNFITSSTFGNRFQFTGREFIQPAFLYDYRNRFYSPLIGRFLQSDPIKFAGGDVNIYRYVLNSPMNFTDPAGLITTIVTKEGKVYNFTDPDWKSVVTSSGTDTEETVYYPNACCACNVKTTITWITHTGGWGWGWSNTLTCVDYLEKCEGEGCNRKNKETHQCYNSSGGKPSLKEALEAIKVAAEIALLFAK